MNNKTEEDIKLIEATIIDKWQKIVFTTSLEGLPHL